MCRWCGWKQNASLLPVWLQSAMELLQIPTAYFITKCDGQLLQIASAFLYKVRHGLLQIATGVTKCDGFITNCDMYYKVR